MSSSANTGVPVVEVESSTSTSDLVEQRWGGSSDKFSSSEENIGTSVGPNLLT